MKKLLASSLLAAFLVFSGAPLAHLAAQDKKADAGDKDKKDKGKKDAGKKAKKAPKAKKAGDADKKN